MAKGNSKIVNEFFWPVRVYYEDTDSGGVVYHTNYLKYMERTRTELLRSHGFEQDQLKEQENIIFAVRNINVDYLKPALFNDLLQVGVMIKRLGPASINFAHTITREVDDILLCQAEIKIACLMADSLRPCPIPENIVRTISHAG